MKSTQYAVLKFDLTDPYAARSFELASKALSLVSALEKLQEFLRSKTKYAPDNQSDEVTSAYEGVREKLAEICMENGVSEFF